MSIGAGPIHKPISRWLMRSAGAVADYRSYRDTVAETLRERIGLNTRADATYPDLAFTLPSPRASRHQRPEGPLAVGVGVLTYVGWHDDAVDGRAIYQGYLTDRGKKSCIGTASLVLRERLEHRDALLAARLLQGQAREDQP